MPEEGKWAQDIRQQEGWKKGDNCVKWKITVLVKPRRSVATLCPFQGWLINSSSKSSAHPGRTLWRAPISLVCLCHYWGLNAASLSVCQMVLLRFCENGFLNMWFRRACCPAFSGKIQSSSTTLPSCQVDVEFLLFVLIIDPIRLFHRLTWHTCNEKECNPIYYALSSVYLERSYHLGLSSKFPFLSEASYYRCSLCWPHGITILDSKGTWKNT